MNIKALFTNAVWLTLEQHRDLNCKNPEVCGFLPVDSCSSADPCSPVDPHSNWHTEFKLILFNSLWMQTEVQPKLYADLLMQVVSTPPPALFKAQLHFSTVSVSSFSSLSPWFLLFSKWTNMDLCLLRKEQTQIELMWQNNCYSSLHITILIPEVSNRVRGKA